jgi:nucleotide-binding universal stress UspA family protein
LLLLHVLSPDDQGYPMPIYPGPDGIYPSLHEEAFRAYDREWQEFERESRQKLQKLTRRAFDQGIATEFTQNVGDPGRAICALAQTWGADLILMGRRGRSGLSEFVLGSVSNYVLHHAPCSILVLQGGSSTEAATEEEAEELATTQPTT